MKPLVWALIAATAAGDDDGREALLLEVGDRDDAYLVITALAAVAAGVLLHEAPSREAALTELRRWVFEQAVSAEEGP